MAIYKLDILQKEKDENLPYWLDATQKRNDSAAMQKIRQKHRDKYLAEQKAKIEAAKKG